MDRKKVNLDKCKTEAATIKKELTKKEELAKNQMNIISSGNIIGPALEGLSNKYNETIAEIEQLKQALAEVEAPKQYRILTLDYFKALCKQNSKVLVHSLLPQRRAFVEKCIEAVILDPCKRTHGVIT